MSIARIMEIGDENVIVYYNFLFILDAVKSIASIFHSFFLSLCISEKMLPRQHVCID